MNPLLRSANATRDPRRPMQVAFLFVGFLERRGFSPAPAWDSESLLPLEGSDRFAVGQASYWVARDGSVGGFPLGTCTCIVD